MTDRLRKLDARFREKVSFGPVDSCWPWLGAKNEKGYGQFWLNGRIHRAHRVAYSFAVGAIPNGKEIDHVCRNRACVNPNHLRVVTHRENVLCGESVAAINAAKTHCSKGHPYSVENTVRRSGGIRRCKTCKREQWRLRWRRLRDSRLAS